jgi:hypothetical protein
VLTSAIGVLLAARYCRRLQALEARLPTIEQPATPHYATHKENR